MSRAPKAFMSYVNLDDQHENGRITQFRERLSGEVRMQTGEPFEIFQDCENISWGQQWQERISESLDATTFLIPIITPAFFKSDACRAELERFLKREEKLQHGDLILPVYYVSCPFLSDKAKRENDKLAQVIATRQYTDWRELRFEPFTSPQICRTLAKMAEQIVKALERRATESTCASAVRKLDAAKETASSANTFHSSGGTQNIAQGSNSIGTQINNYYHQPPVLFAKTELPTLAVDQNNRGDYITITDALKAAKPGTRILIRPGVYREGIVIDKPIEIIGDGERSKIIIESSGKDAVLFRTNMGRIANLTLRQAGEAGYGVNIIQGRLDLEDCDISSQDRACVGIHNGAAPRLRRNRIHDGKTSGVIVCLASQGTLEDNEIFANAKNGIAIIMGGGSPTIRRNRIFQNGDTGIWIDKDGGGIFEDNDLRGNTKGAWSIALGCETRVQRRGNKE